MEANAAQLDHALQMERAYVRAMDDARAYGVGYIRIRREFVGDDPFPTEKYVIDAPESERVKVDA